MLRRHWRRLAAYLGGLAGLAILATGGLYSYREFYEPAEQEYAAEQYQPARDAAWPRPAPKQKAPAPAYQPNCNQPQNHDDADLCAQWGAVRAVNETNRLTRAALKLGFIGFWIAFLGGAIGIMGTVFLVKTFRENRRSADAAHDANRPWIEVKANVKGLWAGSSGANADVQYTLVNHGNSPATGVRLAGKMMPAPASELPHAAPILSKVEEMLARLDSNRPSGGSAIFPGGQESGEFALRVRPEAIAQVSENGACFVRYLVAVGVSYMFGNRAFHTVKCYDAFIREKVDYVTPNQLQRIRLKAEHVTDTYEGFAT